MTSAGIAHGDAVVAPRRATTRPAARVGRWLRSNWLLAIAIAVVTVVLLWALVPGLFTNANPTLTNPSDKLQPPSAAHWMGTDNLGRDLFARIIHGTRASLIGAGLAVLVATVVGSLFGAIAGWLGGWFDTIVMRYIDVVLSIPGFLLAVAIVMLLGFGILQAAVAVGISSSASFARLIRAEVLHVRASAYVEAAVSSGARTATILRRHVIPNSIGPTVSLITVQFGIALIWIASLSFLGLGAQPPESEWGRLVSDGRVYMATAYWLTLFPSLAIVAIVLSANHLSERIRGRHAA